MLFPLIFSADKIIPPKITCVSGSKFAGAEGGLSSNEWLLRVLRDLPDGEAVNVHQSLLFLSEAPGWKSFLASDAARGFNEYCLIDRRDL